jgi:hypothetical protein
MLEAQVRQLQAALQRTQTDANAARLERTKVFLSLSLSLFLYI